MKEDPLDRQRYADGFTITIALRAAAEHRAGQRDQRDKQRRRAVAHVVVSLAAS